MIVVPVMKRPWAASGFMASLEATTPESVPVWAVSDDDDEQTRRAWAACGATVSIGDGPTFANKVQWAYDHSLPIDPPWMLLVGDDVEFHDGWYDWACVAMRRRSVNLIATNDLHNPFVLRGEHATHPIIRRRWVAESGASWDGPGHIAHQGYHHAYVDAEWTARAKQDDCFMFAQHVIIEHHHPTWTRGPTDATYRRGMARYDQDRRLFEDRKARYGQ